MLISTPTVSDGSVSDLSEFLALTEAQDMTVGLIGSMSPWVLPERTLGTVRYTERKRLFAPQRGGLGAADQLFAPQRGRLAAADQLFALQRGGQEKQLCYSPRSVVDWGQQISYSPRSGVDWGQQISYSPRSGADWRQQISYSPRSGADKRSSYAIRPAAGRVKVK